MRENDDVTIRHKAHR